MRLSQTHLRWEGKRGDVTCPIVKSWVYGKSSLNTSEVHSEMSKWTFLERNSLDAVLNSGEIHITQGSCGCIVQLERSELHNEGKWEKIFVTLRSRCNWLSASPAWDSSMNNFMLLYRRTVHNVLFVQYDSHVSKSWNTKKRLSLF